MSRTGIGIDRDRKEISGSQGLGGWEWALTANRYGISFGVGENMLEVDSGAVVRHCEYTKNC